MTGIAGTAVVCYQRNHILAKAELLEVLHCCPSSAPDRENFYNLVVYDKLTYFCGKDAGVLLGALC